MKVLLVKGVQWRLKEKKLIARWTSERCHYYLSKLRRSLFSFIISLVCNRVRAHDQGMHSPASIISIYGNFLRETKATSSLPQLPPSLSRYPRVLWSQPAKQMRSSLQINILREFWTVDYFYWHDDRALMPQYSRKHGALALHRHGYITREGNPIHGEYTGFLRDYLNDSIPRDIPARADPKWHISSELLQELCLTSLNSEFKDVYRKPQLYTVIITKYLLHLEWRSFWKGTETGNLFGT